MGVRFRISSMIDSQLNLDVSAYSHAVLIDSLFDLKFQESDDPASYNITRIFRPGTVISAFRSSGLRTLTRV